MNATSQRLHQWITAADAKRADRAYSLLLLFARSASYLDGVGLHDDMVRNASLYRSLLTQQPGACKAIERLTYYIGRAVHGDHDPEDVRLVQAGSAMLNTLMLGAEEEGVAGQSMSILEQGLAAATNCHLGMSVVQIDSLCRYLSGLRSFLERLKGSRLVFVELPIGNSVPLKLLLPRLRSLRPVLIRLSLSRNNSKSAGITRRELLERELTAMALTQNDVLIYLDEWDTGSNFNALCEFQRKLVPTGAYFLPAAIMTDMAMVNERFDTFRADHDKLLDKWGTDGTRFRKLLPPLPSTIGGSYFFWAEHDRTAGYRKMQLHGSVFSTYDDAIQTLASDDRALRAAAQIFLGEIAEEADLPGQPDEVIPAAAEVFRDAYADYCSCREELRRCADDFAKGGEVVSFDEAAEPVLGKYKAILEGRRASLAFAMASAYLGRIGSMDPKDRYFFKEHAPIFVDLEGRARRVHELTMAFVNARMNAVGETASNG